MNYKLIVMISCMASAHDYVIKLNIDNTTSSDFSCIYTNNLSQKKEQFICKTGEKCQIEWENDQPFKIKLSKIRCGAQRCTLHSRPVNQQTLYAVHKNHITYQDSKFRIVQTWPFNEYSLRPMH